LAQGAGIWFLCIAGSLLGEEEDMQRRRRCRYGRVCYRKSSEHLENFCHPGDHDWAAAALLPEGGNLTNAPSAPMLNTSIYTNEAGEMRGMIEQGAPLMRLAAFCAGCASLVLAAFRLGSFSDLFRPVTYVLDVYLIVFSVTTILFEGRPEWIDVVPGVSKYQEMLIQHCPFLTQALGRGLFYVFLGTLWLSLLSVGFLEGITALALGVVGLLHVLIHFGVLPDHIVERGMHGLEQLRYQ